MFVIAEDEFLERGRRELARSTAVFEPLPSDADRRIHAYKQKEWSPHQRVYILVIPYVGRDPTFPPSQRDKVKQGVDVWEGLLYSIHSRVCRRHRYIRRRLFDCRRRSSPGQVYTFEVVLFNEV